MVRLKWYETGYGMTGGRESTWMECSRASRWKKKGPSKITSDKFDDEEPYEDLLVFDCTSSPRDCNLEKFLVSQAFQPRDAVSVIPSESVNDTEHGRKSGTTLG